MEPIRGFITNRSRNYQLNIINLMKHAVRIYARQEILSRTQDGSFFKYTYKDAYERMQKLANSLESLGVKIGDKIGVLAWNTHQNFEIYYGLPGMGAVMVTLNLRLTPEDLKYIIKHSGIKLLILNEDLIPLAEKISEICTDVKSYVIITDKPIIDLRTSLNPIYSYEVLLKEASAVYEWPYLDENSTYAACYTTGTTGKPKGVYYSHRVSYIQALAFCITAHMNIYDVVFQLVPMFHVLGWSLPLASVYVGARIVFSGKWNLDDLEEMTDIIVKEGITLSGAVPTILMAMLENIKKMKTKPDFNRTRFICGGSEPPIILMKELKELTGAEIQHSYGSTEAMAITTLNTSKPWLDKDLTEEELWKLKQKQGQVVSGLDVKIIDEMGKKLPFDGTSSGEILIKGPWIAISYYNSEDTADLFTEDGFYKTGDAGSIDSEGYLKITDRIKDVIKSGGEWISSIDMENLLVSHPAILEAVVVGVPHPKWEERPLALIVLREGFDSLNKEEINELLLKKFAKWQLPDKILFVDSIPKTSVGKLNKKYIRTKYKDILLNM